MTLRDDDMIRDDRPIDRVDDDTPEGHATPGGAAAAGAVTGGVVGLAGGPVGAVVGAVGGAIAGVITERLMHGGEEHDHVEGDEEHYTDDHEHTGDADGHDHRHHYDLGYGTTTATTRTTSMDDTSTMGGSSMGTSTMGSSTMGTWDTEMPRFRSSWQTRYGSTGGRWEDYEPSYHYGYDMASDPRYRGRTWSEVEPDLRRDYEARYPGSAWERFKESVREAWDSVTGQHTSRY